MGLFDLVPANHGLMEIIARQVEGPYYVVHDALVPLLGLRPLHAQATVRVHDGPGLRLRGGGTRTLHGLTDSMSFAVMLDRPGGDELWEVDRDPRPAVYDRRAMRVARTQPMTQQPRPKTLRVVSSPPPLPVLQVPEPDPLPAQVAWLEELCQREEVSPTRGDYLVIPTACVPADVPLPRWVVRSAKVDAVHVVKPQLGQDRVIEV